jgi:hypothetical protein
MKGETQAAVRSVTQARVMPDSVARSVRTKKDRTARAKIARVS